MTRRVTLRAWRLGARYFLEVILLRISKVRIEKAMMEFSDLARLASGHVEARMIQASVQLGLFDCIGDQTLDAAQVAGALRTELRATDLLLNSLSALALLEKQGDRFSLSTAAKTYLINESPQSLCGMIRFDASLWNCWERLADAVRSGKPAPPPTRYP